MVEVGLTDRPQGIQVVIKHHLPVLSRQYFFEDITSAEDSLTDALHLENAR